MALPVILVDSATGSDTQASGAGPAAALFGTTDASTDGAGTTVTLTAGTDLTNVATDGSHVIFLNDATAGNRNFAKITAKAGSGGATPTVTVANAFGLSLTNKSWAVGGKRATLSSTTSKKLIENNSAAGDARAGWTVEFQSGSTDSFGGTQRVQVTGDTTDGYFEIRGAAGAGTTPIITVTANNRGFDPNAYVRFRDLEFRNSNATKTLSSVIEHFIGTGPLELIGLKVTHATDKFFTLIAANANGTKIAVRVEACEIANTAGDGMSLNGTCSFYIANNYVHNCAGDGIELAKSFQGSAVIVQNVCASNGGSGINLSQSGTNAGQVYCAFNTCYSNTSAGVRLADGTSLGANPSSSTGCSGTCENNICSSNGTYGITMASGASVALQGKVRYNNTYNNTSGQYSPSGLGTNDPGLDPQFTNAGSGDFGIGTNLKAKGYPDSTANVGTFSATRSYVDPGAAQRQESGGAVTVQQSSYLSQNIGTY